MLARPINSAAFMVYNACSSISGSEITTMISAMNTELAALSKVWGRTQIPVLAGVGNPVIEKTPMNAWPVYITDNTIPGIPPGTLGFHDMQHGVPYARVFVNEIRKYGGVNLYKDEKSLTVASVVFHEIVEMFGNCFATGWTQDAVGNFWAMEVCDPVGSNRIVTNVTSVTTVDKKFVTTNTPVCLCDYVYPAWFNCESTAGPYNRANTLTKPFQVDKKGHAIVFDGNSYSIFFGDSPTNDLKSKVMVDLKKMKFPSRRV